jgi:uncharacterized protein (DUF486 family)
MSILVILNYSNLFNTFIWYGCCTGLDGPDAKTENKNMTISAVLNKIFEAKKWLSN